MAGSGNSVADERAYLSGAALVALLFLLALGLYWHTACPTVYFNDGGDMAAASFTLGVAHPTGYPLFCVLGKAMALLPWGNVAFRVNAMSGLFGALALLPLLACLRRIVRPPVAFAGALLYAFSFNHWWQGVIGLAYTVNAFFFLVLLYCCFRWHDEPKAPWGYALPLLAGLGLTNHISAGVAGLAFVVLTPREGWRWLLSRRRIPVLLSCFVLGFSVYFYLPLRTNAGAFSHWGDPRNLERFLIVVTQKQYRAKMLARSAWETIHALLMMIGSTERELTLGGALLALGGGLWLLVRRWRLGLALLAVAAGNLAMMLAYGNQKDFYYVHRYLLPTYAVAAIAAAVALDRLVAFLAARRAHLAAGTVAGLLLVAVPASALLQNEPANNKRHYYFTYDYASNIFRSVALGGTLFVFEPASEGTLAFLYFQGVEGRRPDLKVVDGTANDIFVDLFAFTDVNKYRLRLSELYGFAVATERLILKQAQGPVYYLYDRAEPAKMGFKLKPLGFLWQVEDPRFFIPPESRVARLFTSRGLDDPRLANDFWSRSAMARSLFVQGEMSERRGDRQQALRWMDQARAVASVDVPNEMHNCGIFYLVRGQEEPAIECLERALELDPGDQDDQYWLARARAQAAAKAGRLEAAAAAAGEGLRLKPDDPKLKTLLSIIDQLPALRAQAQAQPGGEASIRLANLYATIGAREEAVSLFEAHLARDPQSVPALNGLALLTDKAGDRQRALDLFKRSLELEPNQPKVRALLQSLEDGSLPEHQEAP